MRALMRLLVIVAIVRVMRPWFISIWDNLRWERPAWAR